jgi:membrane protein implicated in regulation of membrane protease activity
VNTLSRSGIQLLPQPAKGIVDRLITCEQTGRVKYRGTYWFAQIYQPDHHIVISIGEPVNIIGIQGITLLVVPAASL